MTEKTKAKLPDDVQAEFRALRDQVVLLHMEWLLYKDLFVDPQDQEILNATAPSAFILIENALRADMSMTFRRLIDPVWGERNTLSLGRLVRDLEPHCDPEFYTSLQSQFNKIGRNLRPITDLTDRVLAQSDYRTALGTHPEPLTSVGRKHIDEATQLIAELMNDIDVHFNESETAFDHPFLIGTGKDLIKYLRKSLQELKHVLYDVKLTNMSDLQGRLELANRILAEVLGPSSRYIIASWEMSEDDNGRPLVLLTVRYSSISASASFSPDELDNRLHLRQRFLRLWSDLLQSRSSKQLEKILAGDSITVGDREDTDAQ